MKKLLLLGSFALTTLFTNAQVQRTVLIEEFTNASCGPCASQNPAFNTLLANNPTKIVQIKYQTVWPGVDPMNAQNTTEVATCVTKYGVNGVPFAVVDGDTLKNPATSQAYAGAPINVTQAMIDNEYALTTPLSINATYNYNATTDSFTSVVTVTNMSSSNVNASAAGQLKLMFALLEMNINYATAPGTNGETEFYYVMRKMYPGATGTALPDILAPGTPYTFTIKEKAPTYIYKKEQMAIATFVQDLGNNKVYQAKLGLPPNTIDAKAEYLGTKTSTNYCGTTLNPSVKITNLGATALTAATIGYTINGTGGTSQPWTGNLANGQSATVTMPAITAPAGTNIYQFYANAFNTNAIDINESNNTMSSVLSGVVGNATIPFIDFESTAVGTMATSESLNNNPGGSWVVDKTVLASLTQKLGSYGLSDKSYRFKFYDVPAGNRLGLVSYKQNIQGKGYTHLYLDYAYNNYTDANGDIFDTLSVKASSNCGATWTEIGNLNGSALKTTTAAGLGTNYYPAITQWKTVAFPLTATFNNLSDLLFMVEGQSGFGNNLYVDNVKFGWPSGVDNVNAQDAISIYPNPATANITISGINGTAQISIIDVLGRTIKTFNKSNIVESTTLNITEIANGNYFLKINQDGKSFNKSMVISK